MRRPWIKIETCTPDKPEVCSLATQLRLDEDTVVGKLVRLWSWAELNQINPNDLGVTKEFINKLVGRKGFAQALEQTGWLIEADEKLSFRNFKRHNSPVAQNKALTAKRVARHRLRKSADKEKITAKTLARSSVDTPKMTQTGVLGKDVKEVINQDSILIINETVLSNSDLENLEPQNPIEEPAMESSSAVETHPLPVQSVVEGENDATPAGDPGLRKRRSRAAAEDEDQPMLF